MTTDDNEQLEAEVLQSATREASRDMAQRLEYELLGAWRAGYDYVHHYMDTTPASGGDTLELRMRVRQYVLPSNTKRRPDPDGMRYIETYVLKDVHPAEVREALR